MVDRRLGVPRLAGVDVGEHAVRGVARSAPLMSLMPPIAGIAAWLTLGEAFTTLKLAGATITIAGVAWAQFGGGHPPPKESAQADSI